MQICLHESAVGCTSGNSVIGINVGDILLDVVERLDKILIGSSSPIVGYLVGKSLTVARGTSELSADDNEALLSPEAQIPAVAPNVALGDLGSTMNHEDKRIFFLSREIAGTVDEALDVVAILVLEPEVSSRVFLEASKLRVNFVGSEENLLLLAGLDGVELATCPGGGRRDKGAAIRKDSHISDRRVLVSYVLRLEICGSVVGDNKKTGSGMNFSSDIELALRTPGNSGRRNIPFSGNGVDLGVLTVKLSNVQLDAIGLVSNTVHLTIGDLGAVRRETDGGRGTLSGLGSSRTGAVDGDSNLRAIRRNNVNVAGSVIGLWEIRGLGDESNSLAIRADIVVASIVEGADLSELA